MRRNIGETQRTVSLYAIAGHSWCSTERHFLLALMMAWQATVIKGNAGELAAVANSLEVRPCRAVRTVLSH